MAKLRPRATRDILDRLPFSSVKLPSLQGAATIYSRGGTLIMAQRIARQLGATTDARLRSQLWFLYLNLCWVLLHPYFKNQLQRNSIKFWLLARDIFFAAVTGHLFTFDDGKHTYYPYGFIMSVSQSLDSLYQIPGGILYRGSDRWRGLPLGPIGAFLRAGSEGPIWDDQVSPGGGLLVTSWDGGNLVGPGQGAGYVYLSGGRMGITLLNTGTYGVSCGVAMPVGDFHAYVDAYVYSYSTSGGNIHYRFFASVTNAVGNIITSPSATKTLPQPPAGGVGVVSFGPFVIAATDDRHAFHCRIERVGGDPLDTSNSPIALWRLTVKFSPSF